MCWYWNGPFPEKHSCEKCLPVPYTSIRSLRKRLQHIVRLICLSLRMPVEYYFCGKQFLGSTSLLKSLVELKMNNVILNHCVSKRVWAKSGCQHCVSSWPPLAQSPLIKRLLHISSPVVRVNTYTFQRHANPRLKSILNYSNWECLKFLSFLQDMVGLKNDGKLYYKNVVFIYLFIFI